MKILVINAGSSSLKFQLLNTDNEEVLCKGNVERIGEGDEVSFISYKENGNAHKIFEPIRNHKDAMKVLIRTITDQKIGVIKSINEVEAFGHRIANAGPKFFDPIIVTEDVLKEFKENVDFSPLHMPGGIAGIEACLELAPKIPSVAVFDVGFHKTLPDYVYRYAIDSNYYEKYGIRRYGAHGTSHYYVANECAKFLNRPVEDMKIITCHMGGGASICAVKNGKSYDTSMGLTPLEGIMMNTRSGDIDPSVVEFLCKKENLTVGEVLKKLNKESGIYGINNGVSDMRELTSPENINKPNVQLALKMYAYRVKKYIGAYTAAMDGVDAIVFTAGIGENTPELREMILQDMDFFGISIDNDKNYKAPRGENVDISSIDSKVKVCIIPTNEELVIAKFTEQLVK